MKTRAQRFVARGFRLFFDVFVIVRVGATCAAAELPALRHLTDEHHVTAEVEFFGDLAGKHGICVVSEVDQSVFASLKGGKICELIHISSRLHSEVADRFKGHILCQHTDIELPALFHDFPGKVPLLDGDREPCRQTRHLHAGIDDTAVVAPIVLRRQHKETVGQIVQRSGVLFRFAFSESNAPADPSEPCRGGPRRVPSVSPTGRPLRVLWENAVIPMLPVLLPCFLRQPKQEL